MDGRLRLSVEPDVATLQTVDDLVAGERARTREDAVDRGDAPSHQIRIEAQLRMARLVTCGEHRAEQPEQHAEILCGDHVKRAAHQPGPHNRAFLIERVRDVRPAQAGRSRPDAEGRGAQ